MPDRAPPAGTCAAPVREDAWAIVIAERARHQSRQRTGTEVFWRYYLAVDQGRQITV